MQGGRGLLFPRQRRTRWGRSTRWYSSIVSRYLLHRQPDHGRVGHHRSREDVYSNWHQSQRHGFRHGRQLDYLYGGSFAPDPARGSRKCRAWTIKSRDGGATWDVVNTDYSFSRLFSGEGNMGEFFLIGSTVKDPDIQNIYSCSTVGEFLIELVHDVVPTDMVFAPGPPIMYVKPGTLYATTSDNGAYHIDCNAGWRLPRCQTAPVQGCQRLGQRGCNLGAERRCLESISLRSHRSWGW